jgi:hypothetical protein
VLRRNHAETGFWERDEGTLPIWNRDDVMVGHIDVLVYALLRDDPRPWHKSD